MFTGLVEERGRIVARSQTRSPSSSTDSPSSAQAGPGLVLGIEHSSELAERLDIGASLAVSGVCLTVVDLTLGADGRATSTFELSSETLERSTLGGLSIGDPVNLEPALRMGDPMGGHLVQGHVDAVTELLARPEPTELAEQDSARFVFAIPAGYEPYLVEKGSVTLDGVSLTVAALETLGPRNRAVFSVWFVPHTLAVTTFGQTSIGARINFEADVLAKYVERAVAVRLPGDEVVGGGPS